MTDIRDLGRATLAAAGLVLAAAAQGRAGKNKQGTRPLGISPASALYFQDSKFKDYSVTSAPVCLSCRANNLQPFTALSPLDSSCRAPSAYTGDPRLWPGLRTSNGFIALTQLVCHPERARSEPAEGIMIS